MDIQDYDHEKRNMVSNHSDQKSISKIDWFLGNLSPHSTICHTTLSLRKMIQFANIQYLTTFLEYNYLEVHECSKL